MCAESAGRYLNAPTADPYMIIAADARRELTDCAPATVHVDNTVRPQCVSRKVQPEWYDLLSRIGETTGNPVLLNTSFNVRGEPVVCTPADALRCFFSTGIDALVIEDFLVLKQGLTLP
jgi:carbamoyltransferase